MHIPVMKKEVISLLRVKKGSLYMDCTFGEGGHSLAILEQGGVVIAIDRDKDTFIYAEKLKQKFPKTFYWVHSSFSELESVWGEYAFPVLPDGVLFDFGFSSNQIEEQSRGFSFLYDSTLDMRYDTQNGKTALEVLNQAGEEDLANIFFSLGEERQARAMAKTICDARRSKKINTCFELLSILKKFQSCSKKHFATKIFQALRIYVNDELTIIQKGLTAALNLVKFYGRIVCITFHSLEDKIVKTSFGNKNLIVPSKEEILANARARSAKVRWFVQAKERVC